MLRTAMFFLNSHTSFLDDRSQPHDSPTSHLALDRLRDEASSSRDVELRLTVPYFPCGLARSENITDLTSICPCTTACSCHMGYLLGISSMKWNWVPVGMQGLLRKVRGTERGTVQTTRAKSWPLRVKEKRIVKGNHVSSGWQSLGSEPPVRKRTIWQELGQGAVGYLWKRHDAQCATLVWHCRAVHARFSSTVDNRSPSWYFDG